LPAFAEQAKTQGLKNNVRRYRRRDRSAKAASAHILYSNGYRKLRVI